VKSIEQTLKSVAGVSEVSMDLATGVASVIGVVEPKKPYRCVGSCGFSRNAHSLVAVK
jgi:copper chaperone CopZ